MKGMSYNGYFANVEFDAEDHIFVGRIIGIRDVIGFHGESVAELETAFHDAVDNYLAACKELGQKPNKPYSGNLMLRVPAEIHAAVASAAEASGKSINQWATGVLDKASHAHQHTHATTVVSDLVGKEQVRGQLTPNLAYFAALNQIYYPQGKGVAAGLGDLA